MNGIKYCDFINGNDTTGDGSFGNPFKTIQKATAYSYYDIRVAKSPDPTPLTGTFGFTNNGTGVTGVGTLFTTELALGDFIEGADGNWWEVITITNDTTATLYKKYSGDTISGSQSRKLGVTDTGAAAAANTQVQYIGANDCNVSGGWDLSTQTQTGFTYFRQMHGTFDTRNGYGLYSTGKLRINISNLGFLRYSNGIYFTNTNVISFSNITCNSNSVNGISLASQDFGYIFNGIICCANKVNGMYLSNAAGISMTNIMLCSNGTYGAALIGSGIDVVDITSKSQTYGVSFPPDTKVLGTMVTSGNTYPLTYSGNVYINKLIYSEATIIGTQTDSANNRLHINDVMGYSRIFTDSANVVSRSATGGGTGKEWVLSVTSEVRTINYPLFLPIAKVAVISGSLVTVTCYFKKTATSIAGALRCRYGQVTWSEAAQNIVVNCPNDTNRNQVTLQFTPTESGIVEIEALAWYVSSAAQSVIVDDIAVSQA